MVATAVVAVFFYTHVQYVNCVPMRC